MRFEWIISDEDAQRLKSFIAVHVDSFFVQSRSIRNLSDEPKQVLRGEFWQSLISCLLTTQQRSGPESPISRFIRQSPFPLCYEYCTSIPSIQSYAQKTLESFGGIRRSQKISAELFENLMALEHGFWNDCIHSFESICTNERKQNERRAARLLSSQLKGIGPKQSRNLLQMLGLTRYEIPIDSRIIKWLKVFGFPVPLSASCLSDPEYYEFIMDGIQVLCKQCEVFPCILDACIFSSFDANGWNEKNLIY